MIQTKAQRMERSN